ncbi:MAG: hypothetical protein MK008_04615 [Bdellovibrionales bacterium]|nr:hypothetical protein [Bdellovibrionales bacterium]
MKRLLLIVFFSLILSACGSSKQTTDAYDSSPDTEITSQPMQVDGSVLQPELSEQLNNLKGFWIADNNLGYVIRFEDSFLTLVDLETNTKLSFVSNNTKDFGRMLSFVSYESTQETEVVNLVVNRSKNGDIESFVLAFGEDNIAPTYFSRANTSIDYQDEFLKASN